MTLPSMKINLKKYAYIYGYVLYILVQFSFIIKYYTYLLIFIVGQSIISTFSTNLKSTFVMKIVKTLIYFIRSHRRHHYIYTM